MTGAAQPRTTLSVRRYQEGDRAAIERLNMRLKAGGSPHLLFEEPVTDSDPEALPRERLFVVADGDEVRGGAFLRETSLQVGSESLTIGFVKYPVAESLIDRAFASVPSALLMYLMRLQPNLAALGMGGHSGPFAQLLARLKWTGGIVASWIAPLSPHTVAGQLPHLQRRRELRMAAAAVRCTGAAAVAGVALRTLLRLRVHKALRGISVSSVDSFGGWADELWMACRASYRALTSRDATSLAWRYSGNRHGLLRIRVTRGRTHIGWAVIQVADLAAGEGRSLYGKLKLGILCDALALPEDANTVTAAAMAHIMDAGADLVLANHSQQEWQAALRRNGYLKGPENFAFYRSPSLEGELSRRGISGGEVFISRGDDGLFAQ